MQDSDPRLTPPGPNFTAYSVTAGVVAIRKAPQPDAEMVTQALHGEAVHVYEEQGAFAHVQLPRDGYVGWALMEALSAPPIHATHKVSALRTYAYSAPDLKSAPHFMLCLGARVSVDREDGEYVHIGRGRWVHHRHIAPLEVTEMDPVTVARRYIGTPYLWGGRESLGLDCTGLTQQAFEACGINLPRDSDMQYASGATIDDWHSPGALQQNDLLFWKGHVGLITDSGTLIHSNAWHMAVAEEPVSEAIQRIKTYYAEPIGARRMM